MGSFHSAGVVTREIEMLLFRVRRLRARRLQRPAGKSTLLGGLGAVMVIGLAALPTAAPAQQGASGPATAQSAQTAPPKQPKAAPPKTAAAKKKADAPKLDPTVAQGELENGLNALAQGRAEAAVGHLTAAIGSGSLPSAQSARALYYRGVAYRRTAKPAQAISDLTNALWIKGGLTDEQRADALQQRSGAYREAGLPDQGDPQATAARTAVKTNPKSGALANATPFSAVAPVAPAASTASGGGGVGGFFSSIFGGGSGATGGAPPQPDPISAAPQSAASGAVAPAAPATGSVPRPVATPVVRPGVAAPTATASISPSPAPAATAPSVGADGQPKPATRRVPITSDASSGMPFGFQDLPGQSREVEVSTTARAPRPDVAAKNWDQSTEVQSGSAGRQPKAGQSAAVQVATAAPQAGSTAAPKAKAGGGPVAGAAIGNLQVQVAATRSAEEARNLAKRLQTEFGRDLGGRAPVVEQFPMGTSGTLYRVSVGPFATARDTEPLCARLRGGGLECRVATP